MNKALLVLEVDLVKVEPSAIRHGIPLQDWVAMKRTEKDYGSEPVNIYFWRGKSDRVTPIGKKELLTYITLYNPIKKWDAALGVNVWERNHVPPSE